MPINIMLINKKVVSGGPVLDPILKSLEVSIKIPSSNGATSNNGNPNLIFIC